MNAPEDRWMIRPSHEAGRPPQPMTEKPKDNLDGLHAHEEQLRVQSLGLIAKRTDLTDHWKLVQEAMNVIYAFSHDHEHGSDDELTMQFLGIRLFNAAAASIKVALSGYYQKAFVHLRDILETYFLVDYLRSNPAHMRKCNDVSEHHRGLLGPAHQPNAKV